MRNVIQTEKIGDHMVVPYSFRVLGLKDQPQSSVELESDVLKKEEPVPTPAPNE